MDDEQQWSVHDVVNGYERDALARIIRTRGDKRFADRIADAIVAARPVESTTQLAEIVTAAIPAAARRAHGHPAKSTFQAIRIQVKSELDALPDALDQAVAATIPGGLIAVRSHHSGDDRTAYQRFAVAAGACDCPHDLPCVCGAIQTVSIVRAIPKRGPAVAGFASEVRSVPVRGRQESPPETTDRQLQAGTVVAG